MWHLFIVLYIYDRNIPFDFSGTHKSKLITNCPAIFPEARLDLIPESDDESSDCDESDANDSDCKDESELQRQIRKAKKKFPALNIEEEPAHENGKCEYIEVLNY